MGQRYCLNSRTVDSSLCGVFSALTWYRCMLANESCLSHLQQNRAGCVSYLLLMVKWEVEQVRSETESDRRQVRKRQAEKGREGNLVGTPQIFQCWS